MNILLSILILFFFLQLAHEVHRTGSGCGSFIDFSSIRRWLGFKNSYTHWILFQSLFELSSSILNEINGKKNKKSKIKWNKQTITTTKNISDRLSLCHFETNSYIHAHLHFCFCTNFVFHLKINLEDVFEVDGQIDRKANRQTDRSIQKVER